MLKGFSSALDRLITAVAPKTGLKRQYYRAAAKRAELYAAAKTDRLTGPWSPLNNDVNSIIKASSPQVRARVRQLVRDFPYFKRAVQVGIDYTIGSGIKFQSRIKTPDGNLDRKRNQQVEDAFRFWADEADVSGRLHYNEMMQLSKRQDYETGEFILARVNPRNRNSYMKYALQIFEPEWLSDQPANGKLAGTMFDSGIEYDQKTGIVKAYHFTDPDSWGKSTRVKAENVVHGFETLRPNQRRGISPFTPAVMLAHDIGELIGSEINAAKMASKYLAVVEVDNPYERQSNLITDSETSQKLDELENAVIEYLRPGEKINIATNPRPDQSLYPAVALLARMISVTVNIPFELLAGDYTGFSWSTGRLSRNDFEQMLSPVSVRHIRHFCYPTIKPFYNFAVAGGKVDLPGFFKNPAPWIKSEWQPPGMAWIDPLKESKAALDQIKSFQESPQNLMIKRGKDPDEILKDIAEFRDMADSHGLGEFFDNLFASKTSVATANNPAAVMEQDKDKGKAIKKLSVFRGPK